MTNTPEDLYFKDADSAAHVGAGNHMAQPGMMSPVDAAGPVGPVGPSAPPRNWAPLLGVVGAVGFVLVSAVVVFAFIAMDLYRDEQPVTGGSEQTGADDAPFVLPGQSPEAIYDKYIAMSDDGSIYQIIPETPEGWDYFRAFMYKIADYKAAVIVGGALDAEQQAEMLALEKRFLALQDLELTVDITRTDGTRFVHDGKPPAPTPVDSSPAPSATP